MSSLPVVLDDAYGYVVVADRDSGEMVALSDASDRTLAAAASELAQHDADVLLLKRALASELRVRHGVGTVHAGGYDFLVAESQSWPVGATHAALNRLVADGVIDQVDMDRCMPRKPVPDARQLKALIGRLTVSRPDAARVLAAACTVSPPSVRDVRKTSVDAEVA